MQLQVGQLTAFSPDLGLMQVPVSVMMMTMLLMPSALTARRRGAGFAVAQPRRVTAVP